jgi:alkanesulfonate monooxygenase SsuD/methylene tetrahydromethanopterin reductase-like flavin-dependent oxidoreductase (luciferase family)
VEFRPVRGTAKLWYPILRNVAKGQAPPPPVWMAATSTAAIDWAAANGFSILMDPHSSRAHLIRKRRHYGEKLVVAGHSDTGRTIPMARLIARDETAEKASEVARG